MSDLVSDLDPDKKSDPIGSGFTKDIEDILVQK
jgi:hypothetical protein